MLPSLLSRQIRVGVRQFLESTFPSSTPHFHGALEELISRPGAIFKGPYYGLRLPFRLWNDRLPFERVIYPFARPYQHQGIAFQRLVGAEKKSTIVATGTGSGKTECFLYPMLEHCARTKGQGGIKAIVIYPMNALATDQAKRFAQAIHGDPALAGIRAGLYIGGAGDNNSRMQPEWPITDRKEMQKTPPDVLLTNYKMLDYLLIRAADSELWRDNLPDTLQFIAVDELHTFDGAQATDLACLLRRVKKRLNCPQDSVTCVGTSATVGGPEDEEKLLKYATELFGETFGDPGTGAVIKEDTLNRFEFSDGFYTKYVSTPTSADGASGGNLLPGSSETMDGYLQKQYQLWFPQGSLPEDIQDKAWRCQLGRELREHAMFNNLLVYLTERADGPGPEDALLQEMAKMHGDFNDPKLALMALDSLISLCAHARYQPPPSRNADGQLIESKAVFPFLKMHIHLWMRELNRMVGSIGEIDDEGHSHPPRLDFSETVSEEWRRRSLPVIHCRECGTMGWGGTMRQTDQVLRTDLDQFYRAFFDKAPTLRLIFPTKEELTNTLICGHCLRTLEGAPGTECPGCRRGDLMLAITTEMPQAASPGSTRRILRCPSCESEKGLTILGSRAASLASVCLGQSFATIFNDDKKALTFSDNVQDASHRAGFFGARTFRTTLRTAMSKVLPEDHDPISLTQFQGDFLTRYQTKSNDPDFIGLFLPSDMEHEPDFEELCQEGKLPADSTLSADLAKRISFELAVEFGYRARVGRTMEKSGAMAAFFQPESLAKAIGTFTTELENLGGGFSKYSHRATPYLLGLLHRLRIIGGINHGIPRLYFTERGENYHLNKIGWMPRFGGQAPSPTFYYQGRKGAGKFEKIIGARTSPSRAERWTTHSFEDPSLSREALQNILEAALKSLTASSLLTRCLDEEEAVVWGLNPDQLLISPRAHILQCITCSHAATAADEELAYWENAMPCQRIGCTGHYRKSNLLEESYFKDLYRVGEVERIHAREHTGLLDREVRETLEKRFMSKGLQRRKTDPNLLSCTPTLEMGVDIGDLSTVLLCSVPPTTASYTQRIGRAGRTDGNALSLTLANGNPQDLYFYREPDDMIMGDVRTPGVFLDAPAVLERQFFAFCFDRWIQSSSPPPEPPRKLSPVITNVLKNEEPKTGFPFDIIKFIDAEVHGHLQAFQELLPELKPESLTHLAKFALGGDDSGTLTLKLLTAIRQKGQELDSLVRRKNRGTRELRRLEALDPRSEAQDEALTEAKQTITSLGKIIRRIRETQIYEFLTEEGLLPNYAFPEDGITLRGIILRKKRTLKGDKNQKNYEALELDYQRPAAMALRDFAPGNSFYAEGRKLTIDLVDLDSASPEFWNFCDRCPFVERHLSDEPPSTTCPNCQSPSWGDISLRREMVRLTQVQSTEVDRKSRSADESDQRQPQFFTTQRAVWIPQAEVLKAYQLEGEIPFGFEFVRKATIRDINFGQEEPENENRTIAGRETQAAGFRLCRKCGAVAQKYSSDIRHDFTCSEKENPDALFAPFSLYRELTSEALRLLIPSVSHEQDQETVAFISGLRLGLRSHFSGDIEHLQSCPDFRVLADQSLRRN